MKLTKINNKRGVLGGIMTTFIATIVIVLILVGFAVLSAIVKKPGAGVAVPEEEKQIGLANIIPYMDDFAKLTEVRFLLSRGESLEQALVEAGYDK